jgi:hypothetical protein
VLVERLIRYTMIDDTSDVSKKENHWRAGTVPGARTSYSMAYDLRTVCHFEWSLFWPLRIFHAC